MPRRFPKPFFRSARNCWFVQIGKEQTKLHPDEQEAMRLYHELMASRGRAHDESTKTKCPSGELTVAEVFDKFLGWCEKHREARTFEWYHDHIQDFINRSPKTARLAASELKPFHVVEWADSHGDDWSNVYRRGAVIAVQRPFNWAAQLGYIEASPIRSVPKPQPQRREQAVSPEEWVRIRDHYKDGDPFRDILEFAWETGCRPQEAKRVEARHVELEKHRIVFPPQEAKGKKRWRVIYLTPRAEEIVRRLLTQHAEGPLFRNDNGNPWTAQAMACRFGRLKKHLGVKFAAYSIRHGFCQRMLEEGNDHLTVAALMGHASGKMVADVYSHMNRAETHLRQALTKGAEGAVA